MTKSDNHRRHRRQTCSLSAPDSIGMIVELGTLELIF